MTKQEKAEKDYLSGMKYKDIAEKYDISINTVKSWKQRYKWQRGAPKKKNAPKKQKSMHAKQKKGAYKNKDGSSELSPQQELFAQLVGGKRIPLYRAYQIAYHDITKPTLSTCYTNGPRLAKQENIKLRIAQISQEMATKHKWSMEQAAESYIFVHDEAKGDIAAYGLGKANSDAMLNATDKLNELFGIGPDSNNEDVVMNFIRTRRGSNDKGD
jgi:phage terminase small subunit